MSTRVSDWQTSEVVLMCAGCRWREVTESPADGIRAARIHVEATGHSVDVERLQQLQVTPADPGPFEVLGVAESPNPHVQRTWDARAAA
jgi:hypothetical protein